ncbi:N-6 DNA methylase [Hyphomicrobium sp.]|uniref:class I SAM-dependent DNA methyltransferase n=1 Tax=Hyphomicrobium sp. TaxID=82 RepID=UPI000F9A919B|nr:N-6 DNA methylase [Hyphomicrobium sp.]RUO98593.1 MAG: SAM-dependent methyltransferase [Hyphomicrobium sp.]
MTATSTIVAKLWNLSKALQGAGVSYQGYITELTYLLFLKMLEETKHEERLPKGYRWADLVSKGGVEQLDFYRKLLLDLGNSKIAKDPLVSAIFTDAQTALRKPTDLKLLTTTLDELDWFSARDDGLGNLYEGLLEKTTSEKKSKAGQYFTPRPLIDSIVRLVKPQPGEVIQDPACGTGGFLIAADRYIKSKTDELFKLSAEQAHFQRCEAFGGAEYVPETRRLCLMNLQLHGIESSVGDIDSLSSDGEALGKADLVLTNPPFNKMPQSVSRADFSITADERVGPLPFVEHVIRALKPGARAAVVVPDNVLFADGVGARLRTWLMNMCDLHTILRLPTGIFYAQGVKTNVLFFTRGKTDEGNTKAVWVYDLRANMDAFGKTRPLNVEDFAGFEKAFGADPYGKAKRKDEGEEGRFRCFNRKKIEDRNNNLDITWLKDTEATAEEGLIEPEDIAAAIVGHLKAALAEIEGLSEDLEVEVVAVAKKEAAE